MCVVYYLAVCCLHRRRCRHCRRYCCCHCCLCSIAYCLLCIDNLCFFLFRTIFSISRAALLVKAVNELLILSLFYLPLARPIRRSHSRMCLDMRDQIVQITMHILTIIGRVYCLCCLRLLCAASLLFSRYSHIHLAVGSCVHSECDLCYFVMLFRLFFVRA